MKNSAIVLSLVLFLATLGCINEEKGIIVTPEEMQTILHTEDVQLIDVRTTEEYNEGHIENSQNIDYKSPSFGEDILVLDKAKPVILYCRSGKRSGESSKILKKAGFVTVYDLEGGILKWKEKGLEVIVDSTDINN